MAFVSSKLFLVVIKEFVASQVGLVGCQERLNVQAIVGLEIGGVDVRSSFEASILRFPTFHQSRQETQIDHPKIPAPWWNAMNQYSACSGGGRHPLAPAVQV
jgi:hypothetical protein